MERILVTGGAGFVGYEVAKQLVSLGKSVTVIDSLENGLYPDTEKLDRKYRLETHYGVEFKRADLSESSTYDELGQFSSVIHLAAMPGLRYSWISPTDNIRCNVLATSKLLEAVPGLGVSRFLHISTSSVYGSHAIGPESSSLNPESPYGVTKLAAEGLVSTALRRHGLSHSIVRLFSVYGPGQRPDMAYRRFLTSLISDKPQVIFGDGKQTRTNTFVDDAAKGIVACLDRGVDGKTYNIGGVTPISVNEAVDFMEGLSGGKLRRVSAQRVVGDQMETRADISSAHNDFGFENSTNIWEGLKAEYEWLLANPHLLEVEGLEK